MKGSNFAFTIVYFLNKAFFVFFSKKAEFFDLISIG